MTEARELNLGDFSACARAVGCANYNGVIN